MTSDAAAWERMLASMRVFFPAATELAPSSRVVERDGVIACVAPAIPDRSLPNSVVYETEDTLESALEDLERVYRDAGVRAWTVWTPEHHERARRLLADAGHVLDASPAAMILDLAELEPPRPQDPEPDSEPSYADLARVNDRAYGLDDEFKAMLGDGPADPRHAYVARVDGEAAACLGTLDHDGDCSVWWVAVAPEARGRGLAAGLMRRALRDGRERGCEVSTLQATELGRPVYEGLGYRAFGTIEMWERRTPRP